MAELRAERLRAYLAEAARVKFEYGSYDCLVGFVAGWVEREIGRNPGAPFRGRYRTPLGAARLMKRHGGMVALVGQSLRSIGLSEALAPKLGDVGVVEVPTSSGRLPAGAIRAVNGWAVLRQPRGVLVFEARPFACWSV